MGTNNGIGSQGLILDGPSEQKARYLPRLASGELIASFALTEPGAGSDAASLRTRAERDDDEYVINGIKRFITNAPEAGIYTVMARTQPDIAGADGISAILVERGTPGLSLGKPDKKMGQRGAHTCDVIFENCRVPVQNVIGGVEGRGFKTAMKVLDKGRLHIAAICVGAAQRMLDDALRYAMQCEQFGQPISNIAARHTRAHSAKRVRRQDGTRSAGQVDVADLAPEIARRAGSTSESSGSTEANWAKFTGRAF